MPIIAITQKQRHKQPAKKFKMAADAILKILNFQSIW